MTEHTYCSGSCLQKGEEPTRMQMAFADLVFDLTEAELKNFTIVSGSHAPCLGQLTLYYGRLKLLDILEENIDRWSLFWCCRISDRSLSRLYAMLRLDQRQERE